MNKKSLQFEKKTSDTVSVNEITPNTMLQSNEFTIMLYSLALIQIKELLLPRLSF